MKKDSITYSRSLVDYIDHHSIKETPAQIALRKNTTHLEMSIMQISPLQGQFLRLLVSLLNAKNCLEVGTFCGYSALVIAEALPEDGKLITCDINPTWTPYAKKAWEEAGVDHKIDYRLADAVESLKNILKTSKETFDLIFIDADKTNYLQYYDLSFQLLRKGGIMLIDNVFWDGKVADSENQERQTLAIRALNEKIAQDERVMSCIIPIADGFQLLHKL